MSVAEYGAQAWAGIMFGIGAPPAQFFLALCTDEPGTGWDGTVVASIEPSVVDVAYARQPITSGTGWTLSDGGFVINAVPIAYPVPTVDWGNITHFAMLDDAAAGQLWSYGRFLDAIYVPAGYPPTLAIGSIYHALSDQLASIAE